LAKKPRRQKHIPLRTCVVCRQKIDKRRLTRLVRTENDGVIVDPTGKRNGRGAYLCDKTECWKTALESQILDRALRTHIRDADKMGLSTFMPDTQPED
jgi:predicted RNA-binding protein YlxR (DUF448 family)